MSEQMWKIDLPVYLVMGKQGREEEEKKDERKG